MKKDLRPAARHLHAAPFEENGARMVALTANDGFSEFSVAVSLPAYYLITLMDGTHTIPQICDNFLAQFGQRVDAGDVDNLVRQLDEALLLENGRYMAWREELRRQFDAAPFRMAAHAGKSYPEDTGALSALIAKEMAARPRADRRWAESIIVPHIDFRVGAGMMADGWRELPSDPNEIIVILGVGHYLTDDFFACVDKDFQTPAGIMDVDRDFIKALAKNFGEDILGNSVIHKGEHSIEFQALFLAARAKSGPAQKAVPILFSFPDNIWELDHPVFNGKRLERFIAALGQTAAECGKKVRYVASVDLTHVGARFGDEDRLTQARLRLIGREDGALMDALEKMDLPSFMTAILRINDGNRICGFPPLYVLMKLSKAKEGKRLEYRQNVEGEMDSMVSFATIALYE